MVVEERGLAPRALIVAGEVLPMKMGRIFVVTCVQRTICRTNEPVVINLCKSVFI